MSSSSKGTNVYVGNSLHPTLVEEVRKALPDVSVKELRTHGRTVVEEDAKDAKQNAEILFGDSFLFKDVHEYEQLKWIQLKQAGVDFIIKQFNEKNNLPFLLTRINTNALFIGEYVLSYILALERKLFILHDNQKQKVWTSKFETKLATRLISNLTICILGVGNLGKEVAKRCKGLGMNVYGVTRTTYKEEHKSVYVDQYSTIAELSTVITTCDYICCCLPSTPETRGLLSGDVLKVCSDKKPILINCGRGDLINEATIVKAIQEKWLGGAVLDVIEREPLPSDSLLWDLPNVYITPHVSGYNTDQYNVKNIVEIFVENYRRYCDNKPLKLQVNLDAGY
ncbi:hypothetical protein ACF0H5_015109 [Mactra antiquata]